MSQSESNPAEKLVRQRGAHASDTPRRPEEQSPPAHGWALCLRAVRAVQGAVVEQKGHTF